MTSRRRWTVVAAGVVVVVLAGSVVAGVVSSRTAADRVPSSAPPPTPTTTTTTTVSGPTVTEVPTPADVAAARACQAFAVYLESAETGTIPKAVGARLVKTAGVLLRGARKDQAAGQPLPKWAGLGSELLAAAADVVNHKAKALATDGADADRSCATIPDAAARAGGYRRSG
jgi:hypothetical protein